MDGDAFAHDGKSGQWIYSVYRVQAEDGTFNAAADIYLRGEHRCKLVLSMPTAEKVAGLDLLKRRCVAWIEDAEKARSAPLGENSLLA